MRRLFSFVQPLPRFLLRLFLPLLYKTEGLARNPSACPKAGIMQKRFLLVTTYNPGSLGGRYVAGAVQSAGHEVRLLHMKDQKAVALPTEKVESYFGGKPARQDTMYVTWQHPGEVVICPYPYSITEKEMDLFLGEVEAFQPDLVGFSFFSATVETVRKLTARLRKVQPGLPVIWGGVHCIIDPEDCLSGSDETAPDFICVTEGEDPIRQLLGQWEAVQDGAVPEIPGLWVVKKGQAHRQAAPPLLDDLDGLPYPAYDGGEKVIDDDQIKTPPPGWLDEKICLISGRGCPYVCSYCVYSILNRRPGMRRLRRRSVDNVIAEVEYLHNRFPSKRHFMLFDEIFAAQEKWVLPFAEAWKSRLKPRGLTFGGYVHPLMTSEAMVEALYEAGMTQTGMGIQSGSERVCAEIYERPFKREKTIAMSRILARFPFDAVQLDILCDSPYETEADRRETLELLLELSPPFQVETFGLVTYKNTRLAEKEKIMEEVPWKERLFWNMLYHLTGDKTLRAETVRALSRDSWLRENPETLEQLVMDLRGDFYQNNPFYVRPGLTEEEQTALHIRYQEKLAQKRRDPLPPFEPGIGEVLKLLGRKVARRLGRPGRNG